MTTEYVIKKLINGETVLVKEEQRIEVRNKLRSIKKNCTIVLSQIKND